MAGSSTESIGLAAKKERISSLTLLNQSQSNYSRHAPHFYSMSAISALIDKEERMA
jgi:hypothetical protein